MILIDCSIVEKISVLPKLVKLIKTFLDRGDLVKEVTGKLLQGIDTTCLLERRRDRRVNRSNATSYEHYY